MTVAQSKKKQSLVSLQRQDQSTGYFELFERFRFRRHQLLEIIDDLRDELTHHFHQQGSLSPKMQVLGKLYKNKDIK